MLRFRPPVHWIVFAILCVGFLMIATVGRACESFEECIGYAESGLSCHYWERSSSPIVYHYGPKCPPNSGGIDDPIGCTCGQIQNRHLYEAKAIAFKLDEISKKLDKDKLKESETFYAIVDPNLTTGS